MNLSFKYLSAPVVISTGLFCLCGQTQTFEDKFRQLDELLPTPNSYIIVSGTLGNN